ncbi:pilus assembly protein CpaB [Cricetibacter osteomyelitidis]|uniref:Pilus assembly protein CpaB n=1 Tax=Cricetibacter osteomyelitidis TaxID=1521931 RepID=A0A4V2T1S6_9PAST|nr:SAF domain-containing protein [Cricetibacter osteomyelitidis]TCP94653.1 pilus assembly protein CpaB [Cricetibacter osteomyelitidis]
MNYRTLFIISALILIVGIGGILFLPSGENTTQGETQNTSTDSGKEQIVEKVIIVAELKRDVAKNTLLQADDYNLTEIKMPETSPLTANDLKPLLDDSSKNSLQGYLVTENLKAGSLLSPSTVLSPKDPNFLLSSVGSDQEVAFRVYVKADERYLLDTLRGGDYVSVYSQQISADSRNSNEREDLIKVSDKVLVLLTKEFKTGDDNVGAATDHSNKDYIGYLSLKVDNEQVKRFYQLYKDSKLIVLPTTDETKNSNNRGVFIRKLRGQQ